METTRQQSQDAHILMDHYYDQKMSMVTEQSFSEISQYDSSLDYINDTWSIG